MIYLTDFENKTNFTYSKNMLKDEINKNRLFRLFIIRGFIYAHLAETMIFDSNNNIIYDSQKKLNHPDFRFAIIESFSNYDKLDFLLPQGKYIVRFTVDGQFTDNEVILNRDMTCGLGENLLEENELKFKFDIKFSTPPLYSSIPLKGRINYQSTKDYYEASSVDISRTNTLQIPSNIKNSGLFIYLRYSNAEIFQKNLKGRTYWSKFTLYDSDNRIIVKFPNGAKIDNNLGYLGFSADLEPGLYFLKYSGNGKRTIPLSVYPSWYTQVFMILGKTPIFGSLKVLLDRDKVFDSKNTLHSYTDVLLSKLQNRDYTLDERLLKIISYGKYESPLLGLLGAYIYLLGKETKDDNLFRTIISNLKNKILINSSFSQDIYALNFLSHKHFNNTFATEMPNRKHTAMFRIAYDTIRIAASEQEWIIRENSLNDKIAENQYFDSPFNTYRSVKSKYKPNKTVNESLEIYSEVSDAGSIDFLDEETSIKKNIKSDSKNLGWLLNTNNKLLGDKTEAESNALLGYINYTNPNHFTVPTKKVSTEKLYLLLEKPESIGIVASMIVGVLIENPDFSPNDIAKKLNLPISTIRRIQKKLSI